MEEERDRRKKMWNEMDERERKLNVKGIAAFEAAEAQTNNKIMPGFAVDKTFDKEDFKRKSNAGKLNVKESKDTLATLTGFAGSATLPLSSGDRMKHFVLGKNALGKAEQKYALSSKKLPAFSQRSSRARSSMNYDGSAG